LDPVFIFYVGVGSFYIGLVLVRERRAYRMFAFYIAACAGAIAAFLNRSHYYRYFAAALAILSMLAMLVDSILWYAERKMKRRTES